MKQMIPFTFVILWFISLAACGGNLNPLPSVSEWELTPGMNSPSVSGQEPVPEMNPPMPLPEYPVIDGSSSTVLMHMAIRHHLTDASLPLAHSQTYAALERLIPGHEDPAELLLAVKYYDDVIEDANDRGADLVQTPIAKEGFVFLLNKKNPVQSLTQQQIRDIYSGKVTNWKEVGGKDAEIIPLQRNWDSGSQTAMLDFMGDLPIIAGEETPPWSMMMMLESVYNNPDAIGYNMYSWTMEQNTEVKCVAVDGVPLSNETLADSSYPLIIYTYSYYNKDNEKGRALTGWLLTAEGQNVIAGAGYVGIFGELPYDAGIHYYEDETKAYQVVGNYYSENNDIISYSLDWWPEFIYDMRKTDAFSDGKGKAVTAMFLIHHDWDDVSGEFRQTRYIVLTREKGGDFEVINEGEYR